MPSQKKKGKQRQKTKKKQDPKKRVRIILGIILILIILYFTGVFSPDEKKVGENFVQTDENFGSDVWNHDEGQADEHVSDFEALLSNFGTVQADWGNAVRKSPKGDQEFLKPGCDLQDVYVAADDTSFSIKLTVYDEVNPEMDYEFYLISQNKDYQFRVRPGEGAILWKREGPKVEVISPPQGLVIEYGSDFLAVRVPSTLFKGEEYVDVFTEIFDAEIFRETLDPEAAHDSAQITEPIRIMFESASSKK